MSNQRKWNNNNNNNSINKSNNYSDNSPYSSYSSTSTSPTMGRSNENLTNGGKFNIGSGSNNNNNQQSHTPQIGSFTQNYELFTMYKVFSINSAEQQIQIQQQQQLQQQQQSNNGNTSNQFINKQQQQDSGLKKSTSSQKSLSDHFLSNQASRDDHHFNKYGVHSQHSQQQQQQQQQQQLPQLTSILLLTQGGSDDHTFTAMYCSNDYLIFRYVGQSKVPFYKCLKWDKDPNKKIVSMCFDPTAIWLLCLLNDTSCKVIPIYYDMCKKVGFIDDVNNNKSNGQQQQQQNIIRPSTSDKTDRLSNWVSTTRLFKSSINKDNNNNNKDSKDISSNNLLNNLNNSNSTSNQYSGGSGFSKFKIPQLTKKPSYGSNCLWWKTSNSVDYAIITTTSNNIYFVNLVDSSIYKHKFEYSIEKIEMVQSESETFLLIATRSNGYFQLLIEQKIDHHRFETIIQLGNQPSPNNNNSSSNNNNNNKHNQSYDQLSRSSDFNLKTLFQTDRIPSDRVLLVQKTNINQQQQNNVSSNSSNSSTSPQPIGGNSSSSSSSLSSLLSSQLNSTSNENVVVSFLRSTSKLEIYEPLYLNKYPLFVYQLPPNTTNFFFTKHITIVSEIVTTLSPNNSNEAIQRSNVSILSNLVAGTASNSKYINNQSIMQTFQLAPGEIILGISKSLNHHHSNNNNSNYTTSSSTPSSSLLLSNNLFTESSQEEAAAALMKYTKLPTVSLWTNFAIYELRQKKSPEEIFFELVSCNLEKSDGEALGKTFGMDLLSAYETAADIKFDQGQYGRALDLYYLSGVRTNKLVFKFLEIGRMDIIMTHLKAILHQPDSFNVLDRKRISDILFQCYLQKLLTSRDDFKSLDAEFQQFLSSNQDYAVISALSLLSSNGLLDYFFSVAHSRKIMSTALQMLIESDILHLDANNISFLQSAYSHELKSHSNGMIFDCLPPKLQVKLIIDDQPSIPRYLRRLYHILSLLDEKELLDIAETFDPLIFTPPGTLNPKLSKTNPAISHLYQIQQQHQLQQLQQLNYNYHNHHHHHLHHLHHLHTQYQQQHQQYQNQNILTLDDQEFGNNNSMPGRQSESIPIKDEEYFELYLITLLSLIYQRRQKGHHHHSHHHKSRSEKEPKQQQQQDIPDNESDKSTTTCTTVTTNTTTEDSDDENCKINKNIKLRPDPELMICPMPIIKNEKRAIKVSCGWDHVLLISSEGELYSWGNNQCGQLGHGLEIGKTQTTPKKLDFFSRNKSPVIMVECGGEHTIAVDSNYQVYSWGQDKHGQLGHGTKSVSLNKPKIIEELSGQKIQAIAAGYAHTIVLKKSGELFSFGYGEQGQLGHGNFTSKSVPTRIELLNTIVGHPHHGGGKITQISCGFGHSVICSDNGEVYSWGYGKQGQLGHGNFENLSRPRLVDALKGVTKISCGHFYTIATTDLKNVYSWGSGEHMKLGHGSDKNEATPRVVDFFIQKNVSKIVCGLNHTIALTYPGDLNNNSLSNDEDENDHEVNDFTDLGGDENGTTVNRHRVNIGDSQTSPIYAFGAGEHGKLGLGGDLKSPFFDKPIPTSIKGVNALNLIDISCGSDFTAMITSNGSVYVWGNGRFGQIGNGKNDDAWVPIRIPLSDNAKKHHHSNSNQHLNSLNGGNNSNQSDYNKQRYSQDGLEEILRSHLHCYRPFYILNKAIQFENYDIAAVIYDLLNDHQSTLEYKLLSLEKKNLDKDKEVTTILNILSNYFINQKQQLQSSSSLPSSNNNTPSSSSPKLSSLSDESSPSSTTTTTTTTTITLQEQQQKQKQKDDEILLKSQLISKIFSYFKKKDLPITQLENFLITNIEHFSELLSNVIQINNGLELPLILNFTPLFYIKTLKNYLISIKNQSEQEKKLQKVSEEILWQNINENLEKNLLQRSKIEIPTLNQDIYSSLTIPSKAAVVASANLNSLNSTITSEKDIAFTCNHFFSKRTFYGQTLPDFQSEIQKLSIPSQQTLQFIIQEFNKKSISQSCPICLFNSIRDIQNQDETKKDILKLFKLS